MMTRTGDYPYNENYDEMFQAISIPYGDGRMSMYIFLPYPESDLKTLLDRLNTENWEKLDNTVSRTGGITFHTQIQVGI